MHHPNLFVTCLLLLAVGQTAFHLPTASRCCSSPCSCSVHEHHKVYVRQCYPVKPCRYAVVRNTDIYASITEEVKTAMKAKDKEHLMALRNILSALQKESKEVGSATDRLLPNENCVKVLKKLKKMRQDAIQFYRTAGKFNRAEAEEKELQLIQSYLPTQVDESQVRKWAMEAIKLTKASRPSDMGKVMGEMMKQHKSDMDGKVAQVIVASLLKPHQ